MVRTVLCPRCWATSRTRRLPLLSVSRAERISGSSPSNDTSTTAPITWLIRPLLLVAVAAVAISDSLLSGSLERLGARDDFDELSGDRGLTGAVVLDGQAVDHVAGVAGGVVHRRHPAALLRRGVLEQRAEYLDGDVAGEELAQD